MKVLQVELPLEVSEDEARLLLALKLYEVGKVTLGQAVKMAGYSKRAFIELLGHYGVPVISYSPEELRRKSRVKEPVVTNSTCLIGLEHIVRSQSNWDCWLIGSRKTPRSFEQSKAHS